MQHYALKPGIIGMLFVIIVAVSLLLYRSFGGNTKTIEQASLLNQKKGNVMTWNEVLKICRDGNPKAEKRVEKTDAEWQKLLSAEDYRITRLKGTESAFSGEYCERHEPGIYACKCCNTRLFDSGQKFDSGTGWPSFTQAITNNVIHYEQDNSHGMVRVEVTCNVCDAHLGHVFPDGPAPSGLRYCINSKSITKIDNE